ncbi:hypothetical protein Ade02nite_92210 [Paractinoplanes deccanensis]|uniref:Uncharacterized protein n=1 Tax=Paractinoplanes deccanensis TaxID=113561 RepID=A0ABQ3YLA1_9ACTN|nr:hypothetical protein Ade02nite_92210 [Actinoplanes deccanensis]
MEASVGDADGQAMHAVDRGLAIGCGPGCWSGGVSGWPGAGSVGRSEGAGSEGGQVARVARSVGWRGRSGGAVGRVVRAVGWRGRSGGAGGRVARAVGWRGRSGGAVGRVVRAVGRSRGVSGQAAAVWARARAAWRMELSR